MITKEIVNGEEVFAVDCPPVAPGCSKCMFETIPCGRDYGRDHCTPERRDDNRDVFFLPIYDLKTLAAYHAQEATG